MKSLDRKTKTILVIAIIIFVLALLVCLYPLIGNFVAQQSKSSVIAGYNGISEDLSKSTAEEMIAKARAYNSTIIPGLKAMNATEGTPIINYDSDKETEESSGQDKYEETLHINDMGMMGYIEIPKIRLYLPIYHGTEALTLASGVGHIKGTSLPVGGINTHAVLSAHSGVASDRLFSDIDQLEIGDCFYIHILDRVFSYEVNELNVVLPTEIDSLTIRPGEDLCTLMTCTPFGVNTHRLLVTGTRVPYIPPDKTQIVEETSIHRSTWTTQYLRGLLIGFDIALVLALAIIAVAHVRKKKGLQSEITAPDEVEVTHK